MFKISIPKPCFAGWENMSPNEKGRYCNACAKTVVDFSVMSDEAVQHYIINNYGKQICGHFKNTQVQRITIDLPANIFRIQLPSWKKFFIAFLIIYGSTFFSIDTTIAGERYNVPGLEYARSQGKPIFKRQERQLKKHTKKRSRKPKRRYVEYDIMQLDGLISLHEIKGCFGKPYSIYDTVPGIPLQKRLDTAVNAPINASNNGSEPAAPIPRPQPLTEFIIPAVFAARNPFSKKKKA